MDLICTRCGERWAMDYVLHEEPQAFQRVCGRIDRCPCCPKKRPRLSPKEGRRLEEIREIADMLGNDIDGLAAMLEDLGWV